LDWKCRPKKRICGIGRSNLRCESSKCFRGCRKTHKHRFSGNKSCVQGHLLEQIIARHTAHAARLSLSRSVVTRDGVGRDGLLARTARRWKDRPTGKALNFAPGMRRTHRDFCYNPEAIKGNFLIFPLSF